MVHGEEREKHASVAKAIADCVAFMPGINPRPTARMSFSAACEVVRFQIVDPFKDSDAACWNQLAVRCVWREEKRTEAGGRRTADILHASTV